MCLYSVFYGGYKGPLLLYYYTHIYGRIISYRSLFQFDSWSHEGNSAGWNVDTVTTTTWPFSSSDMRSSPGSTTVSRLSSGRSRSCVQEPPSARLWTCCSQVVLIIRQCGPLQCGDHFRGVHSDATPPLLCHKEPAKGKKDPSRGLWVPWAGSLWHKRAGAASLWTPRKWSRYRVDHTDSHQTLLTNTKISNIYEVDIWFW